MHQAGGAVSQDIIAVFTSKIIQYALNFGKPVLQDVDDYLDNNFNWQVGYSTKTIMLHGFGPLSKNYDRQKLRQRFVEAASNSQGISFVKYESINPADRKIVWHGNFTANGLVTSSHYRVTTYFDQDLRILQQCFEQEADPIQQQSAPEISFQN